MINDSSKYFTKSQLEDKIIRLKLSEYLHLLISHILTEISDISVDANDELNRVLGSLSAIPQLFN
jgi:hypothetical protein